MPIDDKKALMMLNNCLDLIISRVAENNNKIEDLRGSDLLGQGVRLEISALQGANRDLQWLKRKIISLKGEAILYKQKDYYEGD